MKAACGPRSMTLTPRRLCCETIAAGDGLRPHGLDAPTQDLVAHRLQSASQRTATVKPTAITSSGQRMLGSTVEVKSVDG